MAYTPPEMPWPTGWDTSPQTNQFVRDFLQGYWNQKLNQQKLQQQQIENARRDKEMGLHEQELKLRQKMAATELQAHQLNIQKLLHERQKQEMADVQAEAEQTPMAELPRQQVNTELPTGGVDQNGLPLTPQGTPTQLPLGGGPPITSINVNGRTVPIRSMEQAQAENAAAKMKQLPVDTRFGAESGKLVDPEQYGILMGDIANQRAEEKQAQREDRQDARTQAQIDAADRRAARSTVGNGLEVNIPGDSSKTGEEYLATLSPGLQGLVMAAREGRVDPKLGSMRGNQRLIFNAVLQQVDPTLDMANYPARVATNTKFNAGAEGARLRNFDALAGHLDKLFSQVDKLGNGRFPLGNALKNAGKTNIGGVDVHAFDQTAQAVQGEIAKLLGLPETNETYQRAQKNLNANAAPLDLKGVVEDIRGIARVQLQALADQYEAAMGPGSFKRFRPRLWAFLQAGESSDAGAGAPAPGEAGAGASDAASVDAFKKKHGLN